MSEEIQNEQEQEQTPDYEEPSLTDLEDVSGGSICATGGGAALD
jgi:hypothetical protein